ncbi:hypothetical protein BG004_002095 [Podila humilis]|nr:hypothetical protein BG004_002095 [Podila humilis]
MSRWMSAYLTRLGMDVQTFEPYLIGILYDKNLNVEQKTATIYECLVAESRRTTANLQDAVAELFIQYQKGGLHAIQPTEASASTGTPTRAKASPVQMQGPPSTPSIHPPFATRKQTQDSYVPPHARSRVATTVRQNGTAPSSVKQHVPQPGPRAIPIIRPPDDTGSSEIKKEAAQLGSRAIPIVRPDNSALPGTKKDIAQPGSRAASIVPQQDTATPSVKQHAHTTQSGLRAIPIVRPDNSITPGTKTDITQFGSHAVPIITRVDTTTPAIKHHAHTTQLGPRAIPIVRPDNSIAPGTKKDIPQSGSRPVPFVPPEVSTPPAIKQSVLQPGPRAISIVQPSDTAAPAPVAKLGSAQPGPSATPIVSPDVAALSVVKQHVAEPGPRATLIVQTDDTSTRAINQHIAQPGRLTVVTGQPEDTTVPVIKKYVPQAGPRAVTIVRPNDTASPIVKRDVVHVPNKDAPPVVTNHLWQDEIPSTGRRFNSWARIDDDEEPNDACSQGSQGVRFPEDEDHGLPDPFDDDEFNPFAPPNASDFDVIQGTQIHGFTAGQPAHEYMDQSFYEYDQEYDDEWISQDGTQQLDMDMTPIEMLVCIFPDTTPQEIERAFEKAGYDFSATIELLMEDNLNGKHPLAQFIPLGDIREKQTCRYFLEGSCTKRDCPYNHDVSSTVCKFWLKGECWKGDRCEFNHYWDEDEFQETVQEAVTKTAAPTLKLPSMDGFDFPSLSATASMKRDPTQTSLPSSSRQSNGSAANSLAYQLEALFKFEPKPAPSTKPLTMSYSATAAAVASKPLTPLQRTSDAKLTGDELQEFRRKMEPTLIPWLETGSIINAQYLEAREQAIWYAKARNNCFDRASKAYLSNDRATALRLSVEGRQYNEMMMSVHREASRAIFESRNQQMIKNTTKDETWIDLHGLHKDECLVFLDEFMERLEVEEYTGMVYVVTGIGVHSSGRAKLKPAVMDWLDSWGYKWEELQLDRLKGGVIALRVVKGRP